MSIFLPPTTHGNLISNVTVVGVGTFRKVIKFLNWSLIVGTKALMKEAVQCDTAPSVIGGLLGGKRPSTKEIGPTVDTKWKGAFILDFRTTVARQINTFLLFTNYLDYGIFCNSISGRPRCLSNSISRC